MPFQYHRIFILILLPWLSLYVYYVYDFPSKIHTSSFWGSGREEEFLKNKLSYWKFAGWREGRDMNPYDQEFETGGEKSIQRKTVSKVERENEKEVGPGLGREAEHEGDRVRGRGHVREKGSEKQSERQHEREKSKEREREKEEWRWVERKSVWGRERRRRDN